MSAISRRKFLGTVGSGMLVSAAGLAALGELDLLESVFGKESERLEFGDREPLVSLIQETPADELMAKLKSRLDGGTGLRDLVAAACLANARTFGGQDYVGYHAFMALVPSLAMSRRLEGARSALPVFKVLHRNARRIQDEGGRSHEVLRPVAPGPASDRSPDAELLEAGRHGAFDAAEATLARLAARGPQAAFAALQPLVRDNIDVHQVVLAYRSWDMMRLTGEANGRALLRQALRQCIDRDEKRRHDGRSAPAIRTLLPELVEKHHLDRPTEPGRRLGDAELEDLAGDLFASDRDAAARQVAAQLGAGTSRDDLGEALSLASVRLLLHDPGRSRGSAGKPRGSVHGASVGLHAADSANAWRGIAAATEPANANACLVAAAWHTAGQSGGMERSEPRHAGAREAAAAVPAAQLLGAVGEALRGADQARSCALAERYLALGRDPGVLIDLLLEPATLHDGALHHEKYFHTATEEHARSRPAFRDEHLVALTRVMASGYGIEAVGLDPARHALGI